MIRESRTRRGRDRLHDPCAYSVRHPGRRGAPARRWSRSWTPGNGRPRHRPRRQRRSWCPPPGFARVRELERALAHRRRGLAEAPAGRTRSCSCMPDQRPAARRPRRRYTSSAQRPCDQPTSSTEWERPDRWRRRVRRAHQHRTIGAYVKDIRRIESPERHSAGHRARDGRRSARRQSSSPARMRLRSTIDCALGWTLSQFVASMHDRCER